MLDCYTRRQDSADLECDGPCFYKHFKFVGRYLEPSRAGTHALAGAQERKESHISVLDSAFPAKYP